MQITWQNIYVVGWRWLITCYVKFDIATLSTRVKHFVLERNCVVLAQVYDSDATFVLVKEVYGNIAIKKHVHWKNLLVCFWFRIWQISWHRSLIIVMFCSFFFSRRYFLIVSSLRWVHSHVVCLSELLPRHMKVTLCYCRTLITEFHLRSLLSSSDKGGMSLWWKVINTARHLDIGLCTALLSLSSHILAVLQNRILADQERLWQQEAIYNW